MTGVGIELSQTKVWTAKKSYKSNAIAIADRMGEETRKMSLPLVS